MKIDKEELRKYLDKGADITGGAIGGAIGLIGGPVGAIAGGALGVVMTQGLKEFINFQLSNRQEIRVAASATYILNGITKKLDSGEKIRQDNFFDNSVSRNNATELFEGVVLKCKDQYQEKKIFHISKIYEKTIFDEDISVETANHILNIADSLTYRKICIISFYGQIDSFDRTDILKDPYSWYENAKYTIEIEFLKQDIFELMNLGIINNDDFAVLSKDDIIPDISSLTEIGNILFRMLELNEIEKDEIIKIYEALKYKNEFGLNNKGTINSGVHRS